MKDIIDIPLDQLIESASNPRKRFDEEKLLELAASITEHGVQQPILVRRMSDLTLEIVYGHRRYRASRLAGLKTIPGQVVLEGDCDDAKALELQLAENNQREDVDPLEEADAICALMSKHGRELADVAAKLGRPEQYVRRRLKLVGLVPGIRALLVDEVIGLGGAEAISALPDEVQEELAENISLDTREKAKRLSSSEVKWAINRVTRSLSYAPWEMSEVFEDLPACDGCPSRSGSQSALPGMDNGEDRCLKMACFNAKGESKRQQLEAKMLAKKGRKSFNKKQRQEIEKHGIYNLYFSPDDSSWALREDRRTYRELAPKAPLYVTVSWANGLLTPREWISKSDVYTHLKEHDPDAYYALKREPNPKDVEAKKAEKEMLEARIEAVCEWAGEQRPTKDLFRAVARAFLTEISAWERKAIAKHIMPEDDPRSIDAYFRDRLEQGTVPDLFRLIVEFTVQGERTGYNIKEQLEHWESIMETDPTGQDEEEANERDARDEKIATLERQVKQLAFQAGSVERPLLETREQKMLFARALKTLARKDLEAFAAAYEIDLTGVGSTKTAIAEEILLHLEATESNEPAAAE